jgi:hypothetical protein
MATIGMFHDSRKSIMARFIYVPVLHLPAAVKERKAAMWNNRDEALKVYS